FSVRRVLPDCFFSPKMRLNGGMRGNSHAFFRWRTVAASGMTVAVQSPRGAAEKPRLCRSPPLRQVPVEDLLAGPEQDARVLADMGEGAADIFQAMRRAHDVGVEDERHDP